MNNHVKENITIAAVYQSMAKKHLDLVKHETKQEDKVLINVLLSRLNANEANVIDRFDEKNKQQYIDRLVQGDSAQYSHILLRLLAMDDDRRNLVETMVDTIYKGEAIEFIES